MPTSVATSTIRRMARPRRQTCRPALRAAKASVCRRAILEAKVVATTMPVAAFMKASISSESPASDRPGACENTLVESQTSAFTPGLPTSAQSASLKGSPTTGV